MAETTERKPPTTGERFFSWMRSLGVVREPGWIGGVCVGVAARVGIDPLIVRGIVVVVAVLGSPALIVYAVAWLLLPDTSDRIHLEQLLRGRYESAIAGIGVMVLLSLLPLSQGFWLAGNSVWTGQFWFVGLGRAMGTVIVIAAAVAFVVWVVRRGNGASGAGAPSAGRPAPTAPAEEFAAWREQQSAWRAENASFRRSEADARTAAWRERHEATMLEQARQRAIRAEEHRMSTPHPLASLIIIGVALIAGGLATLTMNRGEVQVSSVVAGIAVALAVLGLGVVVNGMRGRRSSGPGAVAAVLIVPLVLVLVIPQTSHIEYAGIAHFRPTATSGSLPDLYFSGAGTAILDLRDFYADKKNAVGTDDVYLFAGASDVSVLLPQHESVTITSRIGDGAVYVDGTDGDSKTGDEYEQQASTRVGSERTIRVHIYAGRGDVRILEDSK